MTTLSRNLSFLPQKGKKDGVHGLRCFPHGNMATLRNRSKGRSGDDTMKFFAYRNGKDEILSSPDHEGGMENERQRFLESQGLRGMPERGGKSPCRSCNSQESKCAIDDLTCDQAFV